MNKTYQYSQQNIFKLKTDYLKYITFPQNTEKYTRPLNLFYEAHINVVTKI